MHQDAGGNDLSEIGYRSTLCITKGHSEIHISSRFGLWTRWAVLAAGNIPSKWVCSPLWEAKSIKQLLWHLENPFTMIETIQLKPLQSLLSFSRASTSHIWFPFLQIHWKGKAISISIQEEWHPYEWADGVPDSRYARSTARKVTARFEARGENTGYIFTAGLIGLAVCSLFW